MKTNFPILFWLPRVAYYAPMKGHVIVKFSLKDFSWVALEISKLPQKYWRLPGTKSMAYCVVSHDVAIAKLKML